MIPEIAVSSVDLISPAPSVVKRLLFRCSIKTILIMDLLYNEVLLNLILMVVWKLNVLMVSNLNVEENRNLNIFLSL